MAKFRPCERRRTAAEVRQALKAATIAELDAVGPEGASLRSIARRVGIAHQSVAHHFPDRQSLFTAVAVSGFDDLLAEQMTALAELPTEAPLGDEVATLGHVYVRFVRENRAAISLMFGSRLVDNHDPALIAARAKGWQLHADTVANAVERGWGGTVSADLIAIATFPMAYGLANLEADLPGGLPGDPHVEDLLYLVNEAIIAPRRADG